jgi:hypothetical protein
MHGPKKVINNSGFIANLAPLVGGTAAEELAKVAGIYREILSSLGIKPELENFEGCDQAQLLVKWIRGEQKPNTELIRQWTAEIWDAIDDLAHGKMP